MSANLLCCVYRLYNNPEPSREVLLENVTNLKAAVQKSLLSGSIKNYEFDVGLEQMYLKILFRVNISLCMRQLQTTFLSPFSLLEGI